MFVITADQVNSTGRPDLVDVTMEGLNHRYGSRLLLEFDRNSGDEIQSLTDDALAALNMVLELTRSSEWSVGLGVGPVREPLPGNVRSATGKAFQSARVAVSAAKKRPLRFRIETQGAGEHIDPGPLVDMLLTLRARRTVEGWQLYDLVQAGLTQREAADRLGVTPQAISLRAQSAQLRLEAANIGPLVQSLEALDRAAD
ncbi:MAG: helix-turn-helix transcriptional regulator [Pseudolysinimonas sp.]